MISILGIDAAWTSTEPSGVALIMGEGTEWRTLCVAPSYESFLGCASGHPVDWKAQSLPGCTPDPEMLLSAARSIAGIDPALIALDLPIANAPFSIRRHADRAISEAFGGRGCSTHSPSATRPGPLGAKFMADLTKAGYPLFTSSLTAAQLRPGTIEVFPHPALLVLLNRAYRVPYKVSKSSRYWKNATVGERIVKLLAEFNQIERGLRHVLGDTRMSLPSPPEVRAVSFLK
jgi:predicted RNase H-like nuclease